MIFTTPMTLMPSLTPMAETTIVLIQIWNNSKVKIRQGKALQPNNITTCYEK